MRFYKTGVDITNDKSMFNFLKEHFTYWTMSSWNGLESIANNVKLYNLGLSGDWCNALDLLGQDDNEFVIREMIRLWEFKNPQYKVYFNGRSGGYLVLANTDNNYNVLPDDFTDFEDYDEYKEFYRENYGSVKSNRDSLRYYTQLVQSFDKLCDEIRDYIDDLSNQRYETVVMQRVVEEFNYEYGDDLLTLGYKDLFCDSDGTVDITEIKQVKSLLEAFLRMAKQDYSSYKIVIEDGVAKYEKRF